MGWVVECWFVVCGWNKGGAGGKGILYHLPGLAFLPRGVFGSGAW